MRPGDRERCLFVSVALFWVLGLILAIRGYLDPDATAASVNQAVAFTRPSARAGNLLFQHVFWRLVAFEHAVPFADFVAHDELLDVFLLESKADAEPGGRVVVPGWERHAAEVPVMRYQMDFRLYRHARRFIRERVLRPNAKPGSQYDVVVHVRLEDIFNGQPIYTLLPLSFYRRVFDDMPYNQTVAIVARPISDTQRGILAGIQRVIERTAHPSRVDVYTRGSVADDMKLLMSCRVLVASVSSFWVWPAFASLSVKEVHLPAYGQNNLYRFFDDLDEPGDAIGTTPEGHRIAMPWNDEMSSFEIWEYPLGFVEKIKEHELEERFWHN